MDSYSIGIDIGGTNTDAVLISSDNQIIESIKQPTTSPMEEGVIQAVDYLLKKRRLAPTSIKRISISTTHALNALLQGSALRKTGLIRIASNHPAIPGGAGIPETLRNSFLVGTATIEGGYDCDGTPLSSLDAPQLLLQTEHLIAQGAESIAICSTFGSCFPHHETQAAQALEKEIEPLFLTLSKDVGGIGFLERESATILNCALSAVVQKGFSAIADQLLVLGISLDAIVFVQNDGSEITLEEAIKLPILTLASGPTNSGRGGSLLSNCPDCIVIDVGGTSTDIIQVVQGHVKRSEGIVRIADIHLNFSCPDIYSIALGGGSIIDSNRTEIGPKSVGYKLPTDSQAFGGKILTLFDLGVKAGHITHAKAQPDLIDISSIAAVELLLHAAERIAHGITLVRGEKADLPYILVGGGAPIIAPFVEKILTGYQAVETQQLPVANAFGASQAEISGSAQEIGSLDNREALIDKLKVQATQRAILRGAESTSARVISICITPFAYSKGNLGTITVRVLGRKQKNHAGLNS